MELPVAKETEGEAAVEQKAQELSAAAHGAADSAPPTSSKAKASIGAKEYEEICQLLYLRLKQLEEDFLSSSPEADFQGCRWGDLVDWYIEQVGLLLLF